VWAGLIISCKIEIITALTTKERKRKLITASLMKINTQTQNKKGRFVLFSSGSTRIERNASKGNKLKYKNTS